jgi:hypothetical protein
VTKIDSAGSTASVLPSLVDATTRDPRLVSSQLSAILEARMYWRAIAAHYSDFPDVARFEVADLIAAHADGDEYIQALSEVLRDCAPKPRAPRQLSN